jgi:hypothetical protein
VRAIRGCRWRGPCWQRSTIGSSVGPSSSRSVKPPTKRRRRQGRAVPGGDRRQVGQVEGETAYRLPIGVAVAWSGSRGAGNPRLPLAWPVLAALDHRKFGRAFVLSIGEAGHEATAAPGSSGAGWRSPASGARSNAGQRNGCRLVVPWPGQALGVRAIRGCRWRGPCWQRSITGSSAGPSSSRSVKPATRRRRRQGRAVPGGDRRQGCQGERGTAQRLPIGRAVAWSGSRGAGNPRLPLAWPVLAALDHRQFGRAFVLSIGEAGHEATTAPGSSGAGWRSPASGPGRRRDSAPAADRGCRGVGRISGCWQCSITGSSVGPSFSRSVKPATRRRRRQGRAVPGGDRRQGCQGERGTAQRLPIGRAVAWSGSRGAGNPRLPLAWPVLAALDHRQFGRAFVLSIGEAGHEATAAPGSSGAWWRSPASGPGRRRDSVPAADRGCRGLWSWCRGAGSARPSAVRSGLRSLDR